MTSNVYLSPLPEPPLSGASVPDLTVVGDASIDHFVRVSHIAGRDNKAIGEYLGFFGGGMSANLAAAAASEGIRAQLITKTGADAESHQALKELNGLGVETALSLRDTQRRTWMCFVQLDPTGEKALIGADTGIKAPRINEIDPSALRGSRLVAPLADDLPWATDIARIAKESGADVAVDLEPDAFDRDEPALRSLLAVSDIVFVNNAAARKFDSSGHVGAARAIHGLGPSTVVVSGGAKGAYCSLADRGSFSARSQAGAPAVDTTGAGDALAGSFLGGLLRGILPEQALARAVARATACITRIGSRTYLASTADLAEPDPHPSLYPVTVERH